MTMSEDFQLYTQDYLQEDEDICDVCKNVRKHGELKAIEDERGGTTLVCCVCIATGWAEE